MDGFGGMGLAAKIAGLWPSMGWGWMPDTELMI